VGNTFKALKRYYAKDRTPAVSSQKESYAHPIGYFKIDKIERPIAKKILLNLKQNAIRDIIEYKYFLHISDYLKYLNGELLKSNNQIYYKIGLESRVKLSILLDRQGNFINFIVARDQGTLLQGKNPIGHNLLRSVVIKSLEAGLFNNFFKFININAFKEQFEEIFGLSLYGNINCKEGNIVIIDDQVAYELITSSVIKFFIFMDSRGNYLDTAASDDFFEWENLIKDLHYRKNILPSLNLLNDHSPLCEQLRTQN